MIASYLTKEDYERSLRNPRHKAIREELLEIDKEIEVLVAIDSLKGSQRPPRGLYASQHWSRVYEYPWVIDRLYDALGSIKGKKILDIGPGISALPTYMARWGAEVYCVDTDPLPLPQVTMIDGDIRTFSLAKYDAITCVSVLEHVEDVWLIKVIQKLLAHTGLAVVTMDIPLRQSRFGVPFGAFVDLLAWLCEEYGECPRYPGTHKVLNSSDFGEQGNIVGRDIGIFMMGLPGLITMETGWAKGARRG